MDAENTYTLITGGSGGIGYALARECAGRGMNILLVARIGDGLDAATETLRKEYPVRIESKKIDLRDLDGPQKVWDWCQEEGHEVNMLINNAGMAGTADFEASDLSYSDERILVNVRALVLLTRLFLPELKQHSKAYILNIGSMSAFYPIAYKSVYSASKSFVNTFTRAIKQELRGSNVSITVVHPNGVRTNKSTHDRINAHSGLTKRLLIFESNEIARLSIKSLMKGKTAVVPGFANRVLLFITLMLPRGFRERQTTKIFRKELNRG